MSIQSLQIPWWSLVTNYFWSAIHHGRTLVLGHYAVSVELQQSRKELTDDEEKLSGFLKVSLCFWRMKRKQRKNKTRHCNADKMVGLTHNLTTDSTLGSVRIWPRAFSETSGRIKLAVCGGPTQPTSDLGNSRRQKAVGDSCMYTH